MQWFSTFFKSRNLSKISYQLAEPKRSILLVLFIAFSGNPARNWWNLWVPRNPGWKTLVYCITCRNVYYNNFNPIYSLIWLYQYKFYNWHFLKEVKKSLQKILVHKLISLIYVQVSLVIRGRYVPSFWTANPEFADKKSIFD